MTDWMLGDAVPPPDGPDGGRLRVRTAAEVTPTVVAWLWADRLAYGKLNIIGGPPGVGKSYLTAYLAAAVSRGDRMPGDDRGPCQPARTVLLSYEDDAADTIRPRLDNLHADVELVDVVEGVEDDEGRTRGFGPDDVEMLDAHATRRGDVALVVVDPVSAFVGAATDEHRGNEVRAALDDLRLQAADHGFAVVLVMHTRKSQADTALNRLAGSQAYGALVRSALMAGPIPDTDTGHALAHVKHNLASKQPTLAYHIDDDGLSWDGEIDLDPEEVAGNDDTGGRTAIDEAKAFVLDVLADGPVAAKAARAEAADAGIAPRTLARAKKAVGVESERAGGSWSWTLPTVPRVPKAASGTLGNHDAEVSTLQVVKRQDSQQCQDRQAKAPRDVGILGSGGGDGPACAGCDNSDGDPLGSDGLCLSCHLQASS